MADTPLAFCLLGGYTRSMSKNPCVYIMASKPNGTLYTGVTSDLPRCVYEHKKSLIPGFTKRYNVKTLVWYEPHGTIYDAYQRERSIKRWKRRWKTELIQKHNPKWDDLYLTLF